MNDIKKNENKNEIKKQQKKQDTSWNVIFRRASVYRYIFWVYWTVGLIELI